MSRTRRNKREPGTEYWSRRFPIPLTPGRISKWLTKRRERRIEREELHRATPDSDTEPSGDEP